jgi:hypothetical protein
MEVDRVVHEQPGHQELRRAQAGFVERQAARAHEGVAAQPAAYRSRRDARHVRRAARSRVVDREDAAEERLQPSDPERHRRVGQGRFGHQEADPARLDGLTFGEGGAFSLQRWRAPQAGDDRRQLALDDGLAQILVRQALGRVTARVRRRREGRQDVLVEVVGERSVADIVQQAGDTDGLDHQRLRRDGIF